MEITPGRAPFVEDEDYMPLRMPKSAVTTPTHAQINMTGAASSSMPMGGGAYGYSANLTSSGNEMYARTESPSKLSPFAKEFVPRGAASIQDRLEHQQRHQQQYNQQNYSQYQQHQPQRMQRYSNGYPQSHQQHVQQQQQHMYSLTGSVQERLKISSGGGGGGSGNNSSTNKSNSGNYYQQQQQHGQGQTRQNSKHHHHHQQHRYNQQQQHHPSMSHNHGFAAASSSSSSTEVETIALDYLRSVIQCLNQNPGQFDTIATRFLTIFDGMENNQYVLSNAMEDIFKESIENPNFRYMGAKLYNLLHMLNLKKDSLFHVLLKCKLDYHQEEVVQFMQSNQQNKVRETALFLAELYMQLRGDDSRIHLIAENIVYSLKQLLSKESPDNVRCICLTLKLAGYDLTADCPEAMQQIISQLEAINAQAPGKYPLAVNVISLQKNNWGRKVSSSNSLSDVESLKTPEPLRTSDEPIFYGPDGRELTAEERDFLSGGAAGAGGGSTDDDDEDGGDLDVDFDPEMDEETEKAYKEFCKLNAGT